MGKPKINELWDSIYQNWPVNLKNKKSRKILVKEGRIFNFSDVGYCPTHSTILVSTDKLTAGTFRLVPSAYYFESTHQNSDEFYYVLDGILTITINGENTYDVKKGECFLIASKDKHQVFNFTDKIVEVLLCLAPEL